MKNMIVGVVAIAMTGLFIASFATFVFGYGFIGGHESEPVPVCGEKEPAVEQR